MSKELINKLSNLKLAEISLKRTLDKTFTKEEKRKIFVQMEKIKKEIELIKFKLKMEKEINKK